MIRRVSAPRNSVPTHPARAARCASAVRHPSRNVAPRRHASSQSEVQASTSSTLAAEKAAKREVMRAYRSRLSSIFLNWKTSDADGYAYTDKAEIVELAKKNPDDLHYCIGQGYVDPAILKELFEEERQRLVSRTSQKEKDEIKQELREEWEPLLEAQTWQYHNPEMVRKLADERFWSKLEAIIDGRETNFHFGSWRQARTQFKFEELMENSPLFTNLSLELREEIAAKFEISQGHMTLEHTQPQPPPQHTWVEPPFLKRLNPISLDETKALGAKIASQAQQVLSSIPANPTPAELPKPHH